ncbi:T9SS type A sorting domain-containing protein [Hymenobacter daeguensis]
MSSRSSFGSTALSRAGDYDVFVAQLADAGSSGSFGWALRGGGTGDDRALGLVATATGVCVAGYSYSATASFGPTALVNYSGGGRADIFVTRVVDGGGSGSFAWAQHAGGTGDDQAFGLAISGSALYVAGTVTPQAIFAPLTINAPTGTRIPLLASLTDPTLLATTAAQGLLPFTLAPNPARAATTVALPAQPGTASATLTLRDALGRALRSETVQLPTAGLRHELDLSGLPAGLYAVQVQAGPATATRRLVVE